MSRIVGDMSQKSQGYLTSVVRVGPEKVAHWTLMWNLLKPVQEANVIQGVD